jgi:hypothetical protein
MLQKMNIILIASTLNHQQPINIFATFKKQKQQHLTSIHVVDYLLYQS